MNFGRVSDWGSLDGIQVGDRVQFYCTAPCTLPSSHWGIYVDEWGDDHDQVVYFDLAKGTRRQIRKGKPVLCVESIRQFLGKVRINNLRDEICPPLDRTHIWDETVRLLRSDDVFKPQSTYNHFYNNCEHFVNHCRYGEHHINQISPFPRIFGRMKKDSDRSNIYLVSDWCTAWQLSPWLEVGDRLEFYRTAMPYMHWGIYVGDWGDDHHQIVNFNSADGNKKPFSRSKTNKPELCVESIKTDPGMIRINNKRDNTWPPLNRTKMMHQIERLLRDQSDGRGPEYSLFTFNCEHFVNLCRYGKNHSDQVITYSIIPYAWKKMTE